MINLGRFSLFAKDPTEYSALTLDVVGSSTVIDMLGLLTLDFSKLSAWQLDPARFKASDFQKLKDSGVTVFHPAVGFTGGDIYKESLGDIMRWNSFIAAHDQYFLRVNGPADLERAKQLGKIGIMIGQQNSSHFRSVDDVDRFYQFGQPYSVKP